MMDNEPKIVLVLIFETDKKKYADTLADQLPRTLHLTVDFCYFFLSMHSSDCPGLLGCFLSLSTGGTPARFLIIDDGWQNTLNEYEKDGQEMTDGTQ